MIKKSYLIFLIGWIFLAMLSCSINPQDVIVVGSKMDTEGTILGYIQLLALQNAGFRVEDRLETGPTLIVRKALENGEIDGYIEYTGTALVNFMKIKQRSILTQEWLGYRTIHDWDSLRYRIIWLKPWSGINNTYTVLCRKNWARRNGIQTISDIKRLLQAGHTLTFASDHEFAARPDGLKGLLKVYQLNRYPNLHIIQMDPGLVYQALQQKSVDLAIGYSTDGRIAAFNLVRLTDDQSYFPVYNPTPTYRLQQLKRYPQIATILNAIADKITAEDITRMNFQYDVLQKRAKVLAREWLQTHGFLTP